MIARMFSASILWLVAGAGAAMAEIGEPQPWQAHLQPPATKVMEHIVWFNDFTLVIISVITIFVLGLLAACIVKFRQSANPEPSRVTHNTLLEVASFKLLYAQFDPSKIYEDFDPDTTKFLTVKATGSQWYWDYEYAVGGDNESFGVNGDISFSSTMLADDERGPDDPRLLAVDSELVVPVGTFVRVQVTGADVLHSFAVPSFGIKIDAVPGRLNQTYFKAEHEGIYYGQCSELCGKDHAFMPIAVRVVSADQFSKWAAAAVDDVDEANKLLARLIDEDKTRKLASAE